MFRNSWFFALGLASAFVLSGCGDTLCQEGATQSCKTACGIGTEVCVNNAWANCDAPRVGREICDGNDNDCNGQTDETCECIVGLTESCYEGAAGTETQGKCKGGSHTCTAGRWGICVGQVVPDNSETCDGVDNNCDGATDEGCACVHAKIEPCFTGADSARGKGKCKDGTHVCNMGVWGTCLGEVLPDAKEECDGIDNNCDSRVDESCACTDGNKQACTTPCGKGEAICQGGEWKNCTAPLAQQEVCDGIDNNCDGSVDEVCSCVHGKSEACFDGAAGNRNKGQCKDGTRTCSAGSWGPCQNQILPAATDDCLDLVDNDCDGLVNDGCTCSPGTTQKCGTDLGECVQGTQTCSNNAWGDCANEVPPAQESCDLLDNDCNGQTDDGLPQDEGEPNAACAAAKKIQVSDVPDDDGYPVPATLTYTIYPSGDVDYIEVTALDDLLNLLCTYGKPKCNFLEVEIADPAAAGRAYQATVFTAACDDPDSANNVRLDAAGSDVVLQWQSTCGRNNSATVWIKVEPVASSNPKYTCKPYTLTLTHSRADNQECPPVP